MEQHSRENDLQTTLLAPDRPICGHTFPKGRHCRQTVSRLGDRYCVVHERLYRPVVLNPPLEPPNSLDELTNELSSSPGANEVRSFISKVIRLACQNRISMPRATALTFMANSLLNAIRLANYEDRLAAKGDPEELKIDWTGFPRPERDHPQTDERPVQERATYDPSAQEETVTR
jgi:hypothetical protein